MNLPLAVAAAVVLAVARRGGLGGHRHRHEPRLLAGGHRRQARHRPGHHPGGGQARRTVQVLGAVATVASVLLGELFLVAYHVQQQARRGGQQVDWAAFCRRRPDDPMAARLRDAASRWAAASSAHGTRARLAARRRRSRCGSRRCKRRGLTYTGSMDRPVPLHPPSHSSAKHSSDGHPRAARRHTPATAISSCPASSIPPRPRASPRGPTSSPPGRKCRAGTWCTGSAPHEPGRRVEPHRDFHPITRASAPPSTVGRWRRWRRRCSGPPPSSSRTRSTSRCRAGQASRPHRTSKRAGPSTPRSSPPRWSASTPPRGDGCLELAARPSPARAGGRGVEAHWARPEMAGMRFEACPTRPGDAVFFDSLCAASLGAERDRGARRVLYVTYNRRADGDHRLRYYADKRAQFPARLRAGARPGVRLPRLTRRALAPAAGRRRDEVHRRASSPSSPSWLSSSQKVRTRPRVEACERDRSPPARWCATAGVAGTDRLEPAQLVDAGRAHARRCRGRANHRRRGASSASPSASRWR